MAILLWEGSMADIMPLESLGPRIVIMGPTNAGKFTLCKAISEK